MFLLRGLGTAATTTCDPNDYYLRQGEQHELDVINLLSTWQIMGNSPMAWINAEQSTPVNVLDSG